MFRRKRLAEQNSTHPFALYSCFSNCADLQAERTITSLKTISKPVNQIDFPSVTVCKGGQNLQAVKKQLEKEAEEWGQKRRGKRSLSDHNNNNNNNNDNNNSASKWKKRRRGKRSPSDEGSDYCQHIFQRTCDQVLP